MTANPKKVVIDIDGVCADFVTAFQNLACQLHGVDKQPPEWPPTKWHWPQDYLTKAEIDAMWAHIDATGGDWWEDLEALDQEQTANALLDLVVAGHDLYFLTARIGPGVKQSTESWFAQELALFPTVITGLTPGNKWAVAQAIGADIVVDDRIENCLAMCRETGNDWAPGHILLFDQPWNQTFPPEAPEDYTQQITRISSLAEVVELCGR